jgi:hypothetical protein
LIPMAVANAVWQQRSGKRHRAAGNEAATRGDNTRPANVPGPMRAEDTALGSWPYRIRRNRPRYSALFGHWRTAQSNERQSSAEGGELGGRGLETPGARKRARVSGDVVVLSNYDRRHPAHVLDGVYAPPAGWNPTKIMWAE